VAPGVVCVSAAATFRVEGFVGDDILAAMSSGVGPGGFMCGRRHW
jgi:hypothetical protein